MEDVNHIALALALTRGVVPGDWNRIDATPREIWDRLSSASGLAELGACLGRDVGPVDWAMFEAQIALTSSCGAQIVSRWDEAYPGLLRHIGAPPPVLFTRGDAALLQRHAVAMVGTRAPSSTAVSFATRLARDVAAASVVVVSGMARGIDTAAHRGALDVRGGATIAVLGTGVDVAYPSENAELMERIASVGCIVSEQWMGTEALPHAFPKRNRIISGLSAGAVVVEGGIKSGALITARWALQQGREVGAVPGFPGDFRSAGPNQLLREGAFVVESAADVFGNIGAFRAIAAASVSAPRRTHAVPMDLDDDARRVYGVIVRDADADDVARAAGLDVERALQALVRLEIAGLVVRDGGRFSRRGS